MSEADDFFRSRLDQMIDLRHPLAVFVTNPHGVVRGWLQHPVAAADDR